MLGGRAWEVRPILIATGLQFGRKVQVREFQRETIPPPGQISTAVVRLTVRSVKLEEAASTQGLFRRVWVRKRS